MFYVQALNYALFFPVQAVVKLGRLRIGRILSLCGYVDVLSSNSTDTEFLGSCSKRQIILTLSCGRKWIDQEVGRSSCQLPLGRSRLACVTFHSHYTLDSGLMVLGRPYSLLCMTYRFGILHNARKVYSKAHWFQILTYTKLNLREDS